MTCQARTSRHARTYLATCGFFNTRPWSGGPQPMEEYACGPFADRLHFQNTPGCPATTWSVDRGQTRGSPKRKCLLFSFAYVRQFVPGSSVEQPPASFRCAPAPLLVEVGDAFSYAPVPYITDPGGIAPPMSSTALTSRDDPVEILEVEFIHRNEEGFGADETDGRRDLAQVVRAPSVVVRLDGDADPDVRWPGQGLSEPGEALGTLGEDLVGVPVGPHHGVEDAMDEVAGDVFVEQIRHRVDEDAAGLFPSQREVETLRPEAGIKALLVGMTRNAT